ncbi:MAG: OmpH family outer membrane protein [Bryobacteraceae bacterium]
MKKIAASLVTLASAAIMLQAQTPTKIAVIYVQNALASTKDGQKAAAELQAKVDPKRKALEAKQGEIAALQNELNKGSNTMAEAKRLSLTREIDARQKSLQRETEDASAEVEQEQNKVLGELYQRLSVVIGKYASDNGFAVVLDVSSQQTPVIWAANGIDITKEVVALYDKNAPAAMAPAAPATPMAKPAASPMAPPAKKPPGAVK